MSRPLPAGATGPAAPASPGRTALSPCVNLCRMDAATGLCAGCSRTLAEIAAWGGMDDAARRAVMAQLPQRRAR